MYFRPSNRGYERSLRVGRVAGRGRDFLSDRGLKRGHRGQHSLWVEHHRRDVAVPGEESVENHPVFMCSRFRPLDTTVSRFDDEHHARQQIRLRNMIVAL